MRQHHGGGGKTNVKQFHQQYNFLFVNRISWNEFFLFLLSAHCLFRCCWFDGGCCCCRLVGTVAIFGWSILYVVFFFASSLLFLFDYYLGLGVSPVISFTKFFRSSYDGFMHNFSFLVRFRFMLLLFSVEHFFCLLSLLCWCCCCCDSIEHVSFLSIAIFHARYMCVLEWQALVTILWFHTH